MQFELSIIIPTFRRPQILRRCLDAIEKQTILCSPPVSGSRRDSAWKQNNTASPLEVVIVSDGPDEKTAEMILNLEWPFPIQYFAIPKSQQGACRNAGVKKARGKIALLIGDDALLAPDACERHLRVHERATITDETSGILVLGFTTWDPSLKITPLMQWMEKSGVQFGYPKISKYKHQFLPRKIQHFFTYTIHVSLPAKLLYQNPFREDISLYGWEDIEWGKRLADIGVPIFYEPDTKAYHHHAYADEEVWERSRLLGESAAGMERLVSGIGILPTGFRRLAHKIESWLPTHRGRHWRNFFRGMKNGAKTFSSPSPSSSISLSRFDPSDQAC